MAYIGRQPAAAPLTSADITNGIIVNDDIAAGAAIEQTKLALDAGLTSISGLTTGNDKMIYTTAADTYAVADLTSAGRALLADADAAAQRTTLGLADAATTGKAIAMTIVFGG
jgi:hypothetical protein